MLAIAPIWSPWSVFTVVGIIYLIALFVMLLQRGIIAWGWMFFLLVGGTILVGMCSSDSGGDIDDAYRDIRPTKPSTFDHMYLHKGKWVKGRDLVRNNIAVPEGEAVYRGSLGAGQYLFHPACLMWCPLIVMLTAIPMWIVFRVPWFGSKGLLGK